MSKRKRASRAETGVAAPGQLHEILRDLAKWAVASSLGAAAGCSAHQPELEMRQSEPHDNSPTFEGCPDWNPGGVCNSGTGGHASGGAGGGGTAGSPQTHNGNDPDGPTGPGGVGGMSAGTGAGGAAGSAGVDAGGAGGSTPPMSDDWKPIDCVDNQPQVLVNVAFTQPFDYFGLFTSYPGGLGQSGQYPAGTAVVAEIGTQCANASDMSACGVALGPLRMASDGCVQQMMCASFLITTHGDDVTRRDERSALLTLLGTIDTEYKAALVAMFDGHVIACRDPGVPGQPSFPALTGTETKVNGDGFDVHTEWQGGCGEGAFSETIHVAADGTLTTIDEKTQIAMSNCAIGRRPEGLLPTAAVHRSVTLGRYFADAARLEAASVYAFERLACELTALGAPGALVARAVQSALDEVRHARVTADLARRFGSEPLPADVAALRPRSALQIALENAVEGCVRETYGALLAHYQAQAALDPHVRQAMQQIADDETRHAELSWHVARWLEPQLTHAERQCLAAARTAELAQLFTDLDAGLPAHDARAIGLPAPDVAARMLERLGAALGLA